MTGKKVEAPVPVTILTGFLGAGKTTLLNRILKENHNLKLVVIENEFGEVGVDNDLVKEVLAEKDIIQMNNGVLCCGIDQDLLGVLPKLIQTRRHEIDGIVIEMSGLANPAPICQMFLGDPYLSVNARIDGVLTVVDAKHIRTQLNRKPDMDEWENEATEQIAYADRIIVNKVDLVDADELFEIKDHIRAINAVADMVECSRCQIDLHKVFGIRAQSLDNVINEVMHAEKKEHKCCHHDHHHHHEHEHECCHHDHDHHHHHEDGHKCSHEHEHAEGECEHKKAHDHKEADEKKTHDHHHHHHHHHHHKHDTRVKSIGLQTDVAIDLGSLQSWISDLMDLHAANLYRFKGVVNVHGEDKKLAFHGVHACFDLDYLSPWAEGEKRFTKVVFIGRDLPLEELKKSFDQCTVDAEDKYVSKVMPESDDDEDEPSIWVENKTPEGEAYYFNPQFPNKPTWEKPAGANVTILTVQEYMQQLQAARMQQMQVAPNA